jgi:superfamily I DNA and/or RNA helicase
MPTVAEALEKARQELLDSSLRNRLINYKESKRFSLTVIEESSKEVFEILVRDGRQMTFAPIPEKQKNKEEEANDEENIEHDVYIPLPIEDDSFDDSRLTDTILQTHHSDVVLQRKLRSIDSMARTSIEEQGVNLLYLGLGTLRWYESESSEKERIAPLLMVPVELTRVSVKSRFKIQYNGDDCGINISLFNKLKKEFGIQYDLDSFDSDETEIENLFAEISAKISENDKWSVEKDDIRLGFFSFTKFLMYKDLDPESWPDTHNPEDHEVIGSLLGSGFDYEDDLLNGEHGEIKYEDLFHIMPADSSQEEVVRSLRTGINAIVQGPPGTGKSQTITNIISDFVARGKKVLFVAEKLAALNVVANRLSNNGLGDIMLELHSHKAKKKEVLKELEKTLNLTKPKLSQEFEQLLNHAEFDRGRIVEYCDAVNSKVKNTEFTPIQAYGYYLRAQNKIGKDNIPEMDLEKIKIGDKTLFTKLRRLIEEAQYVVEKNGEKGKNKFDGVTNSSLDFYEVGKLIKQINELAAQLKSNSKSIREKYAPLNDSISVNSFLDVAMVIRLVKLLQKRPNISVLDENDNLFENESTQLNSFLIKAKAADETFNKFKENLIPNAWKADVFSHRQNVVIHGNKWYKFIFSSYRNSASFINSLQKEPKKLSTTELIELTDAILELDDFSKEKEKIKEKFEKVFPKISFELGTNWQLFEQYISWREEVNSSETPSEVQSVIYNLYKDYSEILSELNTESELEKEFLRIRNEINTVFKSLGYENNETNKTVKLVQQGIDTTIQLLTSWGENEGELNDYIQLLKQIDILRKNGLDVFEPILKHWGLSKSHLTYLFEYVWFTKIARIATKEFEAINRFDGETHNTTIEKFVSNEEKILDFNTLRVALQHYEGLPNHNGSSNVGALGLLKGEFAKKRRHLAIRKLMKNAGKAIQAIKPVFMMSPMSIAQYIPPGQVEFDLILFDEASQVKPVDAFGAILRGKQIVVVGDSKQLPPTSFFDSLSDDSDSQEDEFYEVQAGDVESILTMFLAKNAPEKMLRWHYRSKHESLIRVSNHEYYDGNLFIFPSPYETDDSRGLQLRHLPETHYLPGKGGRINPKEADEVAKAAFKHAKKHPDMSLGIAAFSQAQARAISDRIEAMLMNSMDPNIEAFFSNTDNAEPFFVKNLENVQGDEREVIFVSIGYGKQENGKVSMNFGPINKDGGERRLNVLFTRARRKCVIFSNLTHDDIDLTRTQAVGVKALKQFLKFAKTRSLEIPQIDMDEADSIFEEQVAQVLEDRGYKISRQVGSAGFFIDIGVRHPELNGTFVLAIECDGATYHSSRLARDRDKTRQAVLEAQGWTFHRIWSTDWFHNPKREIKRLYEAVERSIINYNQGKKELKTISKKKKEIINRVEVASQEHHENVQIEDSNEYITADFELNIYPEDFHEYSNSQFADWIQKVVEVESPVHKDVVLYRLRTFAGIGRAGKRIQEAFDYGVRYAESEDIVKKRGDILYVENKRDTKPRNREKLESFDRKFEYIPTQEIELGIIDVIEKNFGASAEDIFRSISAQLGFKRTTGAMTDIMEGILEMLEKHGVVKKVDEIYQIVK